MHCREWAAVAAASAAPRCSAPGSTCCPLRCRTSRSNQMGRNLLDLSVDWQDFQQRQRNLPQTETLGRSSRSWAPSRAPGCPQLPLPGYLPAGGGRQPRCFSEVPPGLPVGDLQPRNLRRPPLLVPVPSSPDTQGTLLQRLLQSCIELATLQEPQVASQEPSFHLLC